MISVVNTILNLPLRTGMTLTMFLIFPLKYSEEFFFCFCFVVLINTFHTPSVQYFQPFLYMEGKYLSHSLLFLLIHMMLIEFKIYEKNILVSLSHSLKTSCEKWNEKQRATPFSSHEQWIRIKQIHVILAISWHKNVLKVGPFLAKLPENSAEVQKNLNCMV